MRSPAVGRCNRSACQKSPAPWYNRASNAWYCEECALLINRANTEGMLYDGSNDSHAHLCYMKGDPFCVEVVPMLDPLSGLEMIPGA